MSVDASIKDGKGEYFVCMFWCGIFCNVKVTLILRLRSLIFLQTFLLFLENSGENLPAGECDSHSEQI